jgi:hypothetical protein
LTVIVQAAGYFVPGARVSLDGHGAGISKKMKMKADKNGKAVFKNVLATKKGTVVLAASKSPYVKVTKTITVK